MISAKEAIDQIAALLARRISLEQFEDWSASYAQSAHGRRDAEAVESGLLIRSILNAFGDDNSEDALRLELGNAIRPFVRVAHIEWRESPGFELPLQTGTSSRDYKKPNPSELWTLAKSGDLVSV